MAQDGTAIIARNANPARPRVFALRQRHVHPNPAQPCCKSLNAARKPHVTMLHRTLIDNHCRLASRPHPKINRQPRRLETVISPRKQTPPAQFNRKLSATPARHFFPCNFNFSNIRICRPERRPAIHQPPLTDHQSRIAAKQESHTQEVARPERFELPTLWFEARCSIQLSYGRVPRFYHQCSPSADASTGSTCDVTRRPRICNAARMRRLRPQLVKL